MKSIQAIYKFGNLYDRETMKRILINDGVEVRITLNADDILSEDPNLKQESLLNPEQKKAEIEKFSKKEGGVRYWKLFDSGKTLYFKISAGVKKQEGKIDIICIFAVKLLEDLYIYNKKSEPKYARFFDCECIVEECLTNFDFFEPIHAKSLNDAYTKTYELYFAMFGKSTCNAFDKFFEEQMMVIPIRSKTESIQK